MASKGQLKHIRLLHQKKYRDALGLFIAEGPKVVQELLHSKFKVKEIYSLKEFEISDSSCKIYEVGEKELQSISALTKANQVLATFEIPEIKLNADNIKQELIIALDDIRDPGNGYHYSYCRLVWYKSYYMFRIKC